MKILLHTIALEPARWTQQKVSTTLPELLPLIADAGFREIEIFEPHLERIDAADEVREIFANLGLKPVVLSSYLNLAELGLSEQDVEPKITRLAEIIEAFGFTRVR